MIASLGAISIQAQIHLFLEEQVVDMDDGRSSAWVFPVAHDLDLAMGDLQDYCKDRSDVKLKKEGDNILMGEKVSIPTIATTTFWPAAALGAPQTILSNVPVPASTVVSHSLSAFG